MLTHAGIRGGGGWDVFRNGERLNRHATRMIAVEVAYDLALEAEAVGEETELLVQDEGGKLERWKLHRSSGTRQRPRDPSRT